MSRAIELLDGFSDLLLAEYVSGGEVRRNSKSLS